MRTKILEFLKREKIGAIYVTNKTNIRYFSNFTGTNGVLLLTKKKGFLFTDFRYRIVAQKVLPAWITPVAATKLFEKKWIKILKKYRIKNMGYEARDISAAAAAKIKSMSGNIRWKDAGIGVAELRMQKTVEELAKLKQAQHITDEILKILKKGLRAGQSEKEIAWKIEVLAHKLGAEDISFPPIIGINEHSASPHHQNTDRKLKKGDLILIDMGVVHKGYCSDMTRMLFSSTLSSLEQKIYTLVWKAQENAIRHIHAGISGVDVDAFARNMIKKNGYGKYFGHSLGHGVGLDIHELPNLAETYKKTIPENSVVTVEPGIYLEGKFGVRLEDMVLVKAGGVTNLTKSPKAIQDVTIRL